MSNRRSRHATPVLVAALVLPVILPLLVASPAMAKNNDHRFAQSLEGIRMAHENYCADLWAELKFAEGMAQDNAGTPDGDMFSKNADDAFAKAEKAGCRWAR